MSDFKYIIVKVEHRIPGEGRVRRLVAHYPIIFPGEMVYVSVFQHLDDYFTMEDSGLGRYLPRATPVAAGFIQFRPDGLHTYGASETLGVESKPGDGDWIEGVVYGSIQSPYPRE